MDRRASSAVRLLPERHDDCRRGIASQEPQSVRCTNQGRFHEQAAVASSVPLRHLLRHRRRRTARCQGHEGLSGVITMTVKTENSSDSPITMTLTRRGFVKMGGALFVSIYIPAGFPAKAADSQLLTNHLDPTLLASWLEIRSDNTILMRTGRTETGTGMSGYYPQVIAEELRVRPEVISLIMFRRFSHRNGQRSQSRCIRVPGIAQACLCATQCSCRKSQRR